MRVLRIIASMNPSYGGPSQGIRNFIPYMTQLGVTTEVVSLDDENEPFISQDQFVIHAIGARSGIWGYNPNLFSWLIENLGNYDVAIIHGLWQYHSYAAIRAFKQLKKNHQDTNIKLFVMPHGMLDPYFQTAKGRKLKAIRNWIYWKLLESKVVNDSDGLLFTCEAELILAEDTFKPYKPKKKYNTGYGIIAPPAYNENMVTAFEDRCVNINKAPYILFLSRIHPKKGVDMLLNAYIELSKSLKENDITMPKLVIAGPGLDTSTGKQLTDQLEEFPEMKESILFPGMLNGAAKWGAFYGCEAFILPSHQENFGIAVVEALACNKPVLISDKVNIWREIVAEGAAIVEDDTFTGTKNLLEKWIILNHEQKAEMGAGSRVAYLNHFDVHKIAQNYLSVFNGTSD